MLNSSRLRSWQIARIQRSVSPLLRYLNVLHHRMHELGFPPHDPLFEAVAQAREATHRLDMQLRQLIFDEPGSKRATQQPAQGETRPEQLRRWDEQERNP